MYPIDNSNRIAIEQMNSYTLSLEELKLALILAHASDFVYHLEMDDLKSELENKTDIYLKESFSLPNKNPLNISGFLGYYQDYMLIAFRGTFYKEDWMTNFQFWQRKDIHRLVEKDNFVGKVHNGFAQLINENWHELQSLVEKYSKSRKLLLTGHSLGGALAVLTSNRLISSGLISSTQIQAVYTYGAPRVGDLNFEKAYKLTHYRFEYNNDPVPHLPLPKLPTYKHTGKIRYLPKPLRRNQIDILCEYPKFRKEVKDVFRESRFQPDSEPELSIAFGLARWGRISIRTQNFLEEVNKTIDQKLEDIVKSDFYTLKDALAKILTDKLLKEVIKPCMYALREGEIQTLNDLEPEMKKRALQWLEKPEIQKPIEEEILTWMNKVQEKFLEKEINRICEDYKLPLGNIQLEPITSETVTKDLQDVINKDKLTPTLDFLTDKLLPIVVGIVPTLFFGPIGLLIGIPAAIVLKLWGGEKSKEFINNKDINKDILGLIRKGILTNNKIDEIIKEKQLELKKRIKDNLDEQRQDLIKHCVQHMNEQIKAGIKKQADKASFLIA